MKKKSKKRMKLVKSKMKPISFLSKKAPSYLTSHTKPENLRKYIAGKKRLNRMDRSPFNAWGKPKAIPKKKLTWPQAKIRFPLLKPMGDADKDGVINLLDCRPFNKRRQDSYYHGTANILAEDIKKKGLKPAKKLPSYYKTSEKTDPQKVYVFKKPHHAHTYARGTVQTMGMGKPEVLEIEIEPEELERDYEMEFGEAYAKEGEVEPEKIREYEGDVSYPTKDKSVDYDLDDHDDQTLDYEEEEEYREEQEENENN